MEAWINYSTNWDKMGAPLRPAPTVVDFTHSLIPDGPVLLLGVTPEYHRVFDQVLAIDRNQSMIDTIWPGDTLTKKAMKQEWSTFETEQRFSGIVGDGALLLVGDVSDVRDLNNRSFDWLEKDGVVAQRIAHRPEVPVTKETLLDIMSKPANMNWNSFKWLMCMHVSYETQPKIQPSNVLALFNEICVDRQRLSDTTGWPIESINTIDLYKDMGHMLFPDRDDWLRTVPEGATDIAMTYVYGYDLCELCPVLSYRKHV